jgi:hypothetical protein
VVAVRLLAADKMEVLHFPGAEFPPPDPHDGVARRRPH